MTRQTVGQARHALFAPSLGQGEANGARICRQNA